MRIRNRRQIVGLLAATVPLGVLTACQGAPPTPAKPAQPVATDKLFLAVDTVHGHTNLPAKDARLCAMSNRFPRNGGIVFRARVDDPKTGALMDNKALKSVEVGLANGQKVTADYGAHPKDPPNEFYWTAAWKIPKNHPTGTLKYTVTATAADGRTGTWEPFSVVSSLPTILEDILEDVPEKA